jgi:hypothetical protein
MQEQIKMYFGSEALFTMKQIEDAHTKFFIFSRNNFTSQMRNIKINDLWNTENVIGDIGKSEKVERAARAAYLYNQKRKRDVTTHRSRCKQQFPNF